ncbi:hypothetical protein ACWC5I_18895 [Kitasatospora sp. NPDC001574]
MNAVTGRVLATLGVLAIACGAAAAADAPLRGKDLTDLQRAIHQAGVGPGSWHVTTVSARPGDTRQTVEVVGNLDDARHTLDQDFPGRTTVVQGHVGSDLVWRRGHDYALEGDLQSLDHVGWQVFKTSTAPDGRTAVGVVGDLEAARAYLDAQYPGRVIVHGNVRG